MRIPDIEECECDACGYKEFLTKDEPNQKFWHDVNRTTAEGTTKPFLFCQMCFDDYYKFMMQQDSEFAKWMRGRKNQ